jgi:pyridoxal phosphate enzyme (YggS family)
MNDETGYPDMCWHFIGPLQSNKAAPLVKQVGTNLKCVETVSTLKLANKLNNAVASMLEEKESDKDYKLGIYLQVNTSGEDSKSGLKPNEIADVAKEIQQNCSHLKILGVMTIGAPGDFSCFDTLAGCRKTLAEALDITDETSLEMSMGMSGDFEEAIRRGATNVRVGSTIFGARDYSNKN